MFGMRIVKPPGAGRSARVRAQRLVVSAGKRVVVCMAASHHVWDPRQGGIAQSGQTCCGEVGWDRPRSRGLADVPRVSWSRGTGLQTTGWMDGCIISYSIGDLIPGPNDGVDGYGRSSDTKIAFASFDPGSPPLPIQ